MKSSKCYGPCACGCGRTVSPGEEIEILSGEIFLFGHESGELLGVDADYSKYREPAREQRELAGLPLFSEPEPIQERLRL